MTLSRPLKITGWILLAITVAVILFLMLFDWNMLRPYINRKVSETTGREFAIRGDLDVKFQRDRNGETGWRRFVPQPHITADNVYMSIPAWSTVGKQMAAAQRVEAGVRILPLLTKDVVITDLRLANPDIAVQRRADGSNSWTFKDNGPSEWKVDLQRLAFDRAKVRYVDEPVGLDLRATADSIKGGETASTAVG